MSKKLLIPILVIIIVVSFAMGAFASETTILQTVKLKLMSDIRDSGTVKINGIDEQVRAIVETKLNETGGTELGRANTEIQTYLDSKLQGVEQSPEVQNSIVDLEIITDIMIQEQKDNIDAAISSIFSN